MPSPSPLNLAISFGVASAQLAALLADQRAEEPDTPVRLFDATYKELTRGLDEGRFDLGLSLSTEPDHRPFCFSLWEDELAIALPIRSPLLVHAFVPLQALVAYPVVRWAAQVCKPLSRHVDLLLAQLTGPAATKEIRVSSFEWMATLVAAGYGVGIAPRSRIVQARDCGIVMRPLADGPYPITTQLSQHTRHSSPAAERFVTRARRLRPIAPS